MSTHPSPTAAGYTAPTGEDGEFLRRESLLRDRVSTDGSTAFPAAAGRYHLYVSLACPWAHRTIIFRHLKGLEDVIGLSVVDPIRDERGWAFRDVPGAGPIPSTVSRSCRRRIPQPSPATTATSPCPSSGTGRRGGS